MRKYLFLLERGVKSRSCYDYYDSLVVCASSVDEAFKIHPDGKFSTPSPFRSSTWVNSPDDVLVTFLGMADDHIELGSIICKSFNAG